MGTQMAERPATRGGTARRWLAVVALGLLASCSADPVAAPPERPEAVTLEPGTAQTIDVGSGMRLTVDADSLATTTTIRSTPSKEAPPTIAGFQPSGDVIDIEVDAELANPVSLSFDGSGGPEGAVPVIMHLDPQEGWHPVVVAEESGVVSGPRRAFSPYVPGWLDASTWWDGVEDFFADRVGGRTDAPPCETSPPMWAQVTPAPVDRLVSCLTANPTADGVERVELQVRNNRGFLSLVTVSPAEYVWVDGQPEPVREVLRDYFGADVVALSPGQLMTAGWTRPMNTTTVTATPAYTRATLSLDAIFAMLALADDEISQDHLVLAMLMLGECTGLRGTLTGGTPSTVGGVATILAGAAQCLVEQVEDPAKAAVLAVEAIAAVNGVSVEVAAGDATFAARVDKLAGSFVMAGQLMRWFTLGSDAVQIWERIAEDLALEVGSASTVDLLSVQVTLAGRRPNATCLDVGMLRDLIELDRGDGSTAGYAIGDITCEDGWTIGAFTNDSEPDGVVAANRLDDGWHVVAIGVDISDLCRQLNGSHPGEPHGCTDLDLDLDLDLGLDPGEVGERFLRAYLSGEDATSYATPAGMAAADELARRSDAPFEVRPGEQWVVTLNSELSEFRTGEAGGCGLIGDITIACYYFLDDGAGDPSGAFELLLQMDIPDGTWNGDEVVDAAGNPAIGPYKVVDMSVVTGL